MTTPKLSRLILLFTLPFLVGCFAIADFEIKNEFDTDASTDADVDSDSDIDRDSGDALDAEADSDVRIDADSDRCGDGVCRDGETVETCEVDCPSQCGDGLCTHDERFATCCRDCESECGDRICSSDEAASGSCDQDCLTRWVRICAGSFVMGSPVSEVDRRTDEEQHVVTLTRDFAILSTEVTQQEYIDVIGEIPFDFPGCSNCPAETVSWHDAARYCNGIEETISRMSLLSIGRIPR